MDYLEQRRKLRQMVQERLDYGRDYTDEEVEDTIDEVLMEQENLELCSVELRRRLRKELFDSLRRLDILQIFVDDSSVTEIMINGLDHIFVERDGQLQELDRAFDSMEKLQDVIQQIVAGCNRVVNEASPIVDARLSNGARVNIVMSPIALNGPIITIRRFPDKPITMQKLIAMETISPEAAEFLKTLVKAGYNIFVSGGTGSGKTTFFECIIRIHSAGTADHHHRRQRGTATSGNSQSGAPGDTEWQCGRMQRDRNPGTYPLISADAARQDHCRRSERRGSY